MRCPGGGLHASRREEEGAEASESQVRVRVRLVMGRGGSDPTRRVARMGGAGHGRPEETHLSAGRRRFLVLILSGGCVVMVEWQGQGWR